MTAPITAPLDRGALVRRYKRFLADVRLPDGELRTVHCPNSGSMKGMDAPGLPALVSDSENPARKLRHTLEMVQVDDGAGRTWIGVNTMRPNHHVEAAIRQGRIPGIAPEAPLRREVRYGRASRIDLLVDDPRPVYVEVKNTTLAARADDGVLEARFPDAVTARGTKHLEELMDQVAAGARAMVVFFVNRHDCVRFAPAADIDPAYARRFEEAREAGVEMVPFQVQNRVRRTGATVRASVRPVGLLPAA